MCLACEIFALVKWHAMCLVKWHAMCLACESIALGNLACGRRRQVRCSGTSARSLRRCMGQGKRSRFFQSAPSRTVIARKCFQSTPDRTARRSLLSLRVQLAAAGRANCARATPSRSLGFSGMSSSLRAGSSGRLVTRGPVACFAACHRVAKVSAVVRSRHARCAGGYRRAGQGRAPGFMAPSAARRCFAGQLRARRPLRVSRRFSGMTSNLHAYGPSRRVQRGPAACHRACGRQLGTQPARGSSRTTR